MYRLPLHYNNEFASTVKHCETVFGAAFVQTQTGHIQTRMCCRHRCPMTGQILVSHPQGSINCCIALCITAGEATRLPSCCLHRVGQAEVPGFTAPKQLTKGVSDLFVANSCWPAASQAQLLVHNVHSAKSGIRVCRVYRV